MSFTFLVIFDFTIFKKVFQINVLRDCYSSSVPPSFCFIYILIFLVSSLYVLFYPLSHINHTLTRLLTHSLTYIKLYLIITIYHYFKYLLFVAYVHIIDAKCRAKATTE